MTAATTPKLEKTIVLVGLMGAGKTSVGRRLGERLGWDFVDADAEIEAAAGCSISDIFERHGEAHFREGERRVIRRLLERPPHVLATGGGAFMDPETRQRIAERGISVWLRASLGVLTRRVARRNTRPLLAKGDPSQTLSELIARRYPVYTLADITVDSEDGPHDAMVDRIIDALRAHLDKTTGGPAGRAESVRVELGARGYDIVIGAGLIARAGTYLKPVLRQPSAFVVTDPTVAGLYLEPLARSLADAGIESESVVVPVGEQSKDFAHLERLIDALLAARITRDATIVALGGGVIGDLAGFAAATVLRGVDFAQVPTTLLAQVDSSVGGKTGINTRFGKNLVGSFHQPRLVLSDTAVLDSLPRRELLAGYAEVVKYGLIDQPDLFAWLERHGAGVIAGDAAARRHAIAQSCQAKAAVVAADEREDGARALLNLGHTFGHALEAEAGFGDRLLHGEAVAIGMVMAFALSVRMGLCPADDLARLRRHFNEVGLPVAPPRGFNWQAETLLEHMAHDKKVHNGQLTLVLARGIGQAFLCRAASAGQILSVLADALAA